MGTNFAKTSNLINRAKVAATTTWAEIFATPGDRDGVWLYNPSTNASNLAYRLVGAADTDPTSTVDLTGATTARAPDGEVLPGQSVIIEVGDSVGVWIGMVAGTGTVFVAETV